MRDMAMRLSTLFIACCSLTLFACTQAQANDCEAKAVQIVSKLGATIERQTSMMVYLHHDGVPEGLSIGCDPASSPADGPDINLAWDTKEPPDGFWSLAGSAGAIVADAPSKTIEGGARACYDAARKASEGIAELSRRGVRYECTLLMEEREGSFLISIFRRDAAKQKEIERQFEKSVVRVKSRS
jgi:hypothetical protein